AVSGGVLLLPAFADPAGELVRIEMRVAAVGDGRERAVLECQQCRIRALRWPRRVPCSGLRADGGKPPAAAEAHDVDVMRGLVVDRAAAARTVELFRPAWPIQEVGEVHGGDHPQPTVLAARDQLARAPA